LNNPAILCQETLSPKILQQTIGLDNCTNQHKATGILDPTQQGDKAVPWPHSISHSV
jgi:hypothetical protein